MSWPDTGGRDTAQVYDRFAHVYDLLFGAICSPGRRRAIDSLACAPGDRILEIGVGTGSSLGLYPDGSTVVGVDLSREMLQEASSKRAAGRDGARRHLARMDAQRLAFPDASFDKVVAFYVIPVLPDPALCVTEMKRVCRPGGDLMLVNHFQSTSQAVRRIERLLDPLTRRIGWSMTVDREEILAGAGLEVLDMEPVNLFGYWSLIHARKPAAAAGVAVRYAWGRAW